MGNSNYQGLRQMATSSTTRSLAPTGECDPHIRWSSVCDLKKSSHYVGTSATGQCGIWPLPQPPTGGGGTAVTFASINDLRAYDPTPLGAGALVYLKSYYNDNDDAAAGWFYYDPAGTAADDNGSVIASAGGPGVYFRQLGDALPRPEMFGAKGDAAIAAHTPGAWDGSVTGTDDEPALTKCLEVYGRAVLKANTTYAIGKPVGAHLRADPGPVSMIVEGESRDTIVAFLDGNLAVDGKAQVPMFRTGAATERCELRNLTAYPNQYNFRNDGGPLSGTQRRSLEVLESFAPITKVDTVLTYGYGRGTNRTAANTEMHSESFVISAFAQGAGKPDGHESCVFQRIEFAGPAKEYDAADAVGDELPKSPYPEVTLMMTDGRNAVLVADNYIHDHLRDNTNKPHYHLYTPKDGAGIHVTRNTVRRVDGDLVYQDNGSSDGLVIDHNTFRDGLGAFVHIGNFNHSATADPAKFRDVVIADNAVEMTKQTGSVHPGSYGCLFTAKVDRNTVDDDKDPTTARVVVGDVFDGLTISSNSFRLPAAGTLSWEPRGLLFQAWDFTPAIPASPGVPAVPAPTSLKYPAFRNVAVHDNVFDVKGIVLKGLPDGAPHKATDDCIVPMLPDPWAIVGTPQQMFSEGQSDAIPHLNVVTWRNVNDKGKRVTPWAFTHGNNAGKEDFLLPAELNPSNSFVGYDVDQRDIDYKGVRLGRMWTQGADMTTITTVSGLAHAFYLFGHGVTHRNHPGPDRRSVEYYFHMANESDWTVLMPLVPPVGGENVGNNDICPADIVLRMMFSVPGQTIRIAGKIDSASASPYTVIGTFTVPTTRPLTIVARPFREGGAGTQHWRLIADDNVAHGIPREGILPAWSGGVLGPSVLRNMGVSTNSEGNLWPSPTLRWSLGGPTAEWTGVYSRDVTVSRDCHVANAVNAQEVRLDGLKSAPALATDAAGKIIRVTGGGGGGVQDFIDLRDTPLMIQDGKMLVGGTDALGAKRLEFATVPTGTVTMVKLTVPNTGTSTTIMTETPSGLTNPLLIQVLMRVNTAGTVMTSLAVQDGDVFDASTIMLAEVGLATGAWGNAFQFGIRGVNVIFVRPTPPVSAGSTAGIAFPNFGKKFTVGDAFPVVPHGEVQNFDFIAVLKDVALPV